MGTTTAIKDYLRGSKFRRHLVGRYEKFEILAEGGLRTAVAQSLDHMLSKLGENAKSYRVTCETHLAGTNVIPDILIWRKEKPYIWIELKDTRTFNRVAAVADWNKLQTFCPKYPTIKAGYLIYVARRDSEFPIKRSRATLRFWPIPIVLQTSMDCDFEEWNNKYKGLAHYRQPQPQGNQNRKARGVLLRNSAL